MARTEKGGLGETIRTVIYAVLIAFVVRTFAFEPFNIPSGSMIPTLLIGDYVFVSKYSYGYSARSVAFGLPLFEGRILGSDPERGDVIVFYPENDPNTAFIKRLIGLPGDRIETRQGRLYINDQLVERTRIADYETSDVFGTARSVPRFVETLPNGKRHEILEALGDDGPADDSGPHVVPPGYYFFMGDNRDNSNDSRGSVGLVPADNLVGRAEIRWFSLDDGTNFFEVWKWPSSLRVDRLFTSIE